MSEHWFERRAALVQDGRLLRAPHPRASTTRNDDGIGDFRGLTAEARLPAGLGIDCIWLLPFYPSPLRDDGYDIADFYGVHPTTARSRTSRPSSRPRTSAGIRVIADLVMNHTSDQHPWFQEARRVPRTRPKRDCYVWSDTAAPLRGRADHLHRHRAVELDLGPGRRSVLLAPLLLTTSRTSTTRTPRSGGDARRRSRFWLDLGLDGFRLDAVPYLFEEEGTNCENLPETHAFLKQVRARHRRRTIPDRVLLAEANQWPEDVVAVLRRRRRVPHGLPFPAHAAHVHGAARRSATPIVEILDQTPPIPADAASGACSSATTTS